MAVLQSQSRVSNEMGETISSAEQTSLGVVGEAALGALHGGLQGQSWGRVGLVLQRSNKEGLFASLLVQPQMQKL